MTHFGLIKLESSNLLDITIDGYKVINYIYMGVVINSPLFPPIGNRHKPEIVTNCG